MYQKNLRLIRIAFSLALLIGAPSVAWAQSEASNTYAPTHRFCFTCHGTDGIGNETINAPKLAGMEPWYLQRQLELFRSGARGAHPEDSDGMEMQPMAAILTDAQILDIVDWASTWESIPTTPTLTGGDLTRGRQLYTSCATCHGDQAQGSQAMNAPALQGQSDWYLEIQINHFKEGIRGNSSADIFGSQMSIMARSLNSEQDISDVVSYINTLGR